MTNNFDFSHYSTKELDYAYRAVCHCLDLWTEVESMIADACKDGDCTVTDWLDMYKISRVIEDSMHK